MKFNEKMLLLYAVTDQAWVGKQTLLEQIEDALKGGATIVQLREKKMDEDSFVAEAILVRELCHKYNVPLIINDNVDVALKSGADGVHVGIEDAPVAEIRKRVPADFIIGATCKTVEQAKIAEAAQITAKHIAVLFEHDISVGIENLHTSAEERKNKRYKFGCVARECMAFINALREIHPDKKIGLHLDIGHARNNMPFSSRETLSDWYAECGREIVAMHIHQVSRSHGEELHNHTGFEDFYGMMISLASLAMARKSGQIGEVPMILELRCPVEDSLEVLAVELCGVQA